MLGLKETLNEFFRLEGVYAPLLLQQANQVCSGGPLTAIATCHHPPNLVQQPTWGRFLNTHGGISRNIPCDLHNEHINKHFKEVVKNMGTNLSQESTTTVARSIITLGGIAARFDSQSSLPYESSSHTSRSDSNDLKRVVKVVSSVKYSRSSKIVVTQIIPRSPVIL